MAKELFEYPYPGEKWKHHSNGMTYEIIAVAAIQGVDGHDGEPAVVYRSTSGFFVRLLGSFMGFVELGGGVKAARFERVPSSDRPL